VLKYKRKLKWDERLESIKQAASQKINDKMAADVVDNIELINTVKRRLVADFKAGKLDGTLADLERMIRLEMDLRGSGPTGEQVRPLRDIPTKKLVQMRIDLLNVNNINKS
jgi:hypothetical protein